MLYIPIEPIPVFPDVELTIDQNVKCLAFLISSLDSVIGIPIGPSEGYFFEAIAVSAFGHSHPAIGLCVDTRPKEKRTADLIDIGWEIQTLLTRYVRTLGASQLLSLAKDQAISWDHNLDKLPSGAYPLDYCKGSR